METSISSGRSYRARKQRPCDACRKRKSCCVRESESAPCSLCKIRSKPCTFLSAPNQRRRRDPPPTDQPSVNGRGTGGRTPELSLLVSEHATRSQIEVWPFRNLDDKASATSVEDWIPQFVGLSGDQDPFVLRHCHFDDNEYKRPGWACLRVNGGGTGTPTHFTIVPGTHLDAHPEWYPKTPLVDMSSKLHKDLVRAYLSVVHTSYPLLDPNMFQARGERLDNVLLGAVYGLTKVFVPTTVLSDLHWADWLRFLYQALPLDSRQPRLETVEAGLCFIQRHAMIHRAPMTPGLWSEIGSLVGIAHELGLNVDPTGWDIEPSQKRRRIRIAWGLFIADKWTALGLGRPSYISSDDWNVPMINQSDFSDEVDEFSRPRTQEISKSLFIAMAHLTRILAQVLKTFYTLKGQNTVEKMTAEELTDVLAVFEGYLDRYDDDYLLPLQNMVVADQLILDPTGTAILAFHTIRIMLYRAVLRHISSPTVRKRSRDTLMSASNFLETLQVSRLRAFWWSPVSKINFAIIGSFMFSMLLSSTNEEEVEFWSNQIDRYRRLLELQSISFDTTKLAVKRLELLATFTEEKKDEGPKDKASFSGRELWDLYIEYP